MKKKKKYKYAIGIDAGTATGFAVWDCEKKKFEEIGSMYIHKAMFKVRALHVALGGRLKVRVEDARKRTWYNDKGLNAKGQRGRAMGAASVKRDSSIWEDFLQDTGIEYEMVHPKDVMTKLDAEQFKKYTNHTHRTNEHGRDAGMLVFGL